MRREEIRPFFFLQLTVSILAIAFILGFIAGRAHGFPSNVRKGYHSCVSCHVSPTGGGVLTAYGAMTSEEFLSTWADKGESGILGHVPLPANIRLGGDLRYLAIQRFFMQAELEAAVQITPGVFLDAAGGSYGPDGSTEFRRNFLLFNVSENITLRAGKFFPAYGIAHADHTTATRQGLGFDEGDETYNGEISLRNDWGEIFVTGILGSQALISMANGYNLLPGDPGFSVKASGNLPWKTTVLGTSYLQDTDRQQAGAYMMSGITDSLYTLEEIDYKILSQEIVSAEQVGYEVVRGFHVILEHSYSDQNVFKAMAQWFPRPHFEVYLSFDSNLSAVILGHYYI